MLKHLLRIGMVVIAGAAALQGCANHSGSPSAPQNYQRVARAAQSACGEVAFLSQLSPVLPVWEDSIQTWLGGTDFLDSTPTWTDQSTVDGYLATLIPVLQQWRGAINDGLDAAVLDSLAAFDPATQSRQQYLGDLSTLLASWETALETRRETDFLPTLPVFAPDETAPELACLEDTTITCADSLGVAVSFEVTAVDDCDPSPVVTSDPPSGTLFPLGETVVTTTAVDSSGNTSTCTFTVNVQAAEPPVITNVRAKPCILWPPNHKWVDVAIKADIESACDLQVHSSIVEVTSNEADNGQGDGNTSPDWMITGDNTLQLRAERSGGGSGRVYSVHVRFEDDLGNVDDRWVDVKVPHDMGHGH